MGQDITLTSKDGFQLGAYKAEPEGKPRGAVVVIQEIFGVNHHIRSVADRYAQLGYLAIAPALFDRGEKNFQSGYDGAAMDKARGLVGKISLDDPAAKFVPQWENDPRKSQIKIRHLGSHTSGIEDAEADMLSHDKLTGWKGDFWRQLDPPHDPFSISRDLAPMLFDPGQKLQYSNPGIGMLTYCVTAAIQDSECKDIRTLLRRRVMQPIGVSDNEWSCGYNKTYTVNGLPLVCSWGGGSYSARACASIGRLMLRQGDWDGQRLLSTDAVQLVTGSAGLPGACGMGWWTNAAGRYARLPSDAYWGAGAGDQLLVVVPSLNLIMVRNGQTLQPGPGEEPVRQDDVFTRYHDYRARILLEPLIGAVNAASTPATAAKGSDVGSVGL